MDRHGMTNDSALQRLWHRALDLLSHPAWNGLTCFITAFTAISGSTILLAYFLGVFKHIQDLLIWLCTPIQLPTVAILGGVFVILALFSTAVYRRRSYPSRQAEQGGTAPSPRAPSEAFEPSKLDIEIMKQLATAKENHKYWLHIGPITAELNLTENRADYLLRTLERHGLVHQHRIDGTWGIQDKGIDYLIEHRFI